MEQFDFMVIGSGSGLDVANLAANRGESVAVVEKGRLGGTCLNRGCIPSKLLLYHAHVYEMVQRAEEFGIEVTVDGVAFADVVREVTEQVHGEGENIRAGLEQSDRHTLLDGEARFVDDRTVEISGGDADGVRARAETVLVAAGTRPAVPDVDGIESVDYLTSTEALTLETLPDHLVVLGGGYIAVELAQFFGTFGSDVTIVGRRPHLVADADRATGAELTERYAERFTVHTGYEAVTVSQSREEVTLEARPYPPAWEDPSAVDSVSATGDALLIAAGRRPNTDTLDLAATGVETDERGFVETDEYLRTTAEGIWALGDVVGEYLLKHSANHEAQAVARNRYGDELRPVDYSAMPFAVFGSPELAGVGATQDDLEAADREFVVGSHRYEDTARGDAMHASGLVKVLAAPSGEILGCHIVGPDASALVQEVVVAMTAGSGTVSDVRESVHVHPALPEVVQRAFSGPFHRPGEHQH